MTINLHLGNSSIILGSLDSNSIDLTVTSPPYDNLRNYKGFTFDFESIAKELYRVTKNGGVVVWIVGDATINGSETGTSFKQALYFKEIGFNLHDTMIWKKPNFANPSSNRYHQTFEYMFVLSKGKPNTFNSIKDRKNIYAGNLGSVGVNTSTQIDGSKKIRERKVISEFGQRHNVWEINTSGQENMGKTIAHPATFPEKLVHDHIISWSNEGDIVLDCFLGSGTTGKVAKQLNRHFIGIEISPEYLEISKQRIFGEEQ
jgi:site-specific DNA-methyltransferase (adenine-specific)